MRRRLIRHSRSERTIKLRTRILRDLLICLALGSVINIAVAFCLFNWTPLISSGINGITINHQPQVIDTQVGRGVERTTIQYQYGLTKWRQTRLGIIAMNALDDAWEESADERGVTHDPATFRKRLSRRAEIEPDSPDFYETDFLSPALRSKIKPMRKAYVVAAQAGWPFPAFYSAKSVLPKPPLDGDIPPPDEIQKLIDDINNTGDPLGFPRGEYPRYPLWIGLLLNTLIYTAIVYMLIPCFAYRHVQSLLRSRRNQCLRCGYSLANAPSHDSPCPECGA